MRKIKTMQPHVSMMFLDITIKNKTVCDMKVVFKR